MSDLPDIRPEPEDDRYDVRLKARLAKDCLKLSEAGMFEHAMAALWEIGMGKTMDGKPIDDAHPRTRASALASFARAMSTMVAQGVTFNDNRTQIVSAIDLVKALEERNG